MVLEKTCARQDSWNGPAGLKFEGQFGPFTRRQRHISSKSQRGKSVARQLPQQ